MMHDRLGETLRVWVQVAANAVELLAVVIILAGVAFGTTRFVLRWTSSQSYIQYKGTLDKALLLGLNVLVAADIVRTVALEPTITNVLGLGLLVFVRTFVSWSLLVELEERWPWQLERSAVYREKGDPEIEARSEHP
jgi:uncharacterized membrane protein